MADRIEINNNWNLTMTELNFDEITTVSGGMDESGPDGLGPNSPPLPQKYVCRNLEAFLIWQHHNPFYGY
jgi:hypothetical protein